MFEEHPGIQSIDDNIKIWKYMSFAKFVNLLSGELYFNRIDLFEDVFECRFTNKTRELIAHSSMPALLNEEKIGKKLLYVSCFHASEFETAFMWRQYSNEDGIAIQTTVGKLKEAFSTETKSVFIGNVQYLDYNVDQYDPDLLFNLALHKRKSFEAEKEVRCICMHTPSDLKKGQNLFDVDCEKGIKIQVNLEELIETIYVSPYAPSYILKDVEMVLEKFALNKEIIKSELYSIK